MGDPCGTRGATFRHSGDLLANNFPSGPFDTLWVEKVSFRGTSGGSGHAIRTRLRMFLKVDQFGKMSCPRRPWEGICGILAPFWEPLGQLCALLGALAATCCRTVFAMRFLAILCGRRPPRLAVGGAGADPLALA